ncbi:MAG TPA: 1,2-phenylacetyl-CoA epoxidase subunit PaaC [Telluria sp.]|nr:1,2-phenylacetyl-CoA epoxidase subunit PaaC [Telluria sp.]
MNANDKIEYLLRQGDNALILSQQLSQLCGKGPALEEDMALTNVALDLLGQTRMWYAYATELEGRGRSEDDLAFLRDAPAMRCCLLVEQPNGNYADTMMRQFYFDTWHYFLMKGLLTSTDARVAEIAEKSIKEVTYHLRRSGDLIVRLGDGSEESHAKTQAAASYLWPYTGEMFIYDAVDNAMAEQGVAPPADALRAAFLEHVAEIFAEATLAMPPADAWMHRGGKKGVHSEHLGYILAEMQFLQRAYPGAEW